MELQQSSKASTPERVAVESSAHKLVGLHFTIAASLAALGALWVAMGPVSPAQGYVVPPSPYLSCLNDGQSDLKALETSLTPANGATVQEGTLVTFKGTSAVTPGFAVASSPALLSNPDIDGGSGFAQPQPSSSGSSGDQTYTFTSTRATIAPGTIYWDASFSDATLAECAGLAPTTYTTAKRTLTIVPAPTPPAPAPPPAPAEPLPLRVDISVTSSFHLAHPTVTYRVHCTASCTGE